MIKTWKRYRERWGCLTLSTSVSQKSKGKWLDAEKAFREAVAEILSPSVIMYGIKHTNVWTRWVQTAWTSAVSMPIHRQHQRSKSDTNLGYHRKTRFTADFFFHLLWECMGESWACAIVCVGKSENNSGSVLPHHVNLRGGTWAWQTPFPEGPFHCPPSSIFVCLSLWKQAFQADLDRGWVYRFHDDLPGSNPPTRKQKLNMVKCICTLKTLEPKSGESWVVNQPRLHMKM